MNRLSDRFNMSPDFAWTIKNGYVKKDIKSGLGIIKQREGVAKFNTVTFTNACKYVYEAKWNAGGVDVIIREGTRWAKYDGVDTFEDFDTGRASGVRGMCAMFANQLIMVDGGVPRKSTSAYVVSNLSADGAMPTDSSAVHVHQHKVWLNSDSAPMLAYYSKTDSANAADSWSAANDAGYLDFSKILPTGDKLIGFYTFAQALLVFVFKRYAVVYSCGTDPANFAIQQVIPLNCISGHGIQQIGNDLAVASQEGVNSFRSSLSNQDLDLDDLSKYIAPLYREYITPLNDKGIVSFGYSHALNHLYCCIPGTEHTILVYSLDIQNFVGIWTGYDCYSICERVNGSMLVGGTGYVYTMNSGADDDGVAIDFRVEFPGLYAKDADHNKAFRQIEGLARHDGSPLLQIDYSYSTALDDAFTPLQIQFTSSGGLWDESDWDTTSWAGGNIERFLNSGLLGRGKQIIPTLSNSVLGATIEIPYLIFRYNTEGRKIR